MKCIGMGMCKERFGENIGEKRWLRKLGLR